MPDFGFVGTSYEAPSIYQDAQECINFYAEIDPQKQAGERGVVALYPTPGLLLQTQLAAAEVRGLHTMSGGQILIAVSGANVYSVNTSMVATLIGTLSSVSGQVSISDNITTNNGLTAYIVDGANRYTWIAATNTFAVLPSTDGPWQGANVTDQVDNYFLYNEPGTQNWACSDLGLASSSLALYGTADGSSDLLVSLIVDRRQVYLLGETTTEVWTDVGNVIAGITSFPFQRVPGTTSQSGINARFSLARFGDSFVCVAKDTRGNGTIEMMEGYTWVRISTHAVEQTLIGQYTSDAIAYTYQIEGHEMYVVTFPTINLTWVYDLSTKSWHKWLAFSNGVYSRHRSNCGAFFANRYIVGDYQNGKLYSIENAVYTEDGATIRRLRRAPHLVADFQRQYFDELQIQFQPGVGLGVTPEQTADGIVTELANVPPAGPSYQLIAEFDWQYLATESGDEITTEAGDGFESLVTFAYSGPDTAGAEIVTEQYPATPGYDPQAMLRWSSDGGSTWSSEHWTSIGKMGQYNNRAIWRRLGWGRDRVFEVSISAPVKTVIISANLKASAGDN
jgi:hypothetical protein